MSIPFFFPLPRVVPNINIDDAMTLRSLLESAGAQCRASGRWTERLIVLVHGESGIERAPGDWGAVRIGIPQADSALAAARYAAAAMAYALMDVVARESIKGLPWTKPSAPRGRPPKPGAQTNAARQRSFRLRHKS